MTKTNVKLSYGHGFLEECTNAHASNWDKTEDGMTLAAIIVSADDIFDLQGTVLGGNNQGYWQNHTALGLSTNVYTKMRIRYKTGGGGCHAKFDVLWNGGGGQGILTVGSATEWTTFDVDLNPGSTLDYIRMYVKDASGHVYVDFILICKGDFTFPNTAGGLHVTPEGRFGILEPVGMGGAHTQNLGSLLVLVNATCDLDIGTWTRAGDTMPGQVFLDVEHNSVREDFQWLQLGDLGLKFKATLLKFEFTRETHGSASEHKVVLDLREYRRSDASQEYIEERFGLL